MDRKSTHIPPPGFTLLELLLVLAVLAGILTVGVPSLRVLVQNNQLSAESGRFLAAINLARSEAVARGQPVSICPSPMASTGEAGCSGTFEGGWLVFANRDRDKFVDPGDEVIRVFDAVPSGFRMTNRAGTRTAINMINYLPDGSSSGNRTVKFCPPAPVVAQAVSIVINIVGRARLLRGRDQCALV